MRGTLVLLAGYPATGKSYLRNLILGRHPKMAVISQDEIKESLWDAEGFNNIEEKTSLELRAWELFYARLSRTMGMGRDIISDYPFSEKQRFRLQELARSNGYQVLTVRLVGDIDVLYARSRSRDLDPSRNVAHLVSKYPRGDVVADREHADCFVTLDEFRKRCTTRGYDTFCLGKLIEVDVTDYSKVDYGVILTQIDDVLENEKK